MYFNSSTNAMKAYTGSAWQATSDGAGILANTNRIALVIPQTVSGTLTAGGQVNQLRDSGSFTFPLASSVAINTKIVVELPDKYKAQTPVVTASGADTIVDGDGSDTSITFGGAAKVTLTSDGTSVWEL